MTKFMQRTMACLLSVLLVMAPFTTPQAAMIGTGQILESTGAEAARQQIRQFIDRETTRQQLIKWGVNPEDVRVRVNRLNDSELARINQAIDNPDAGGNSILGILLIIFIVFVITDVIGATDIFPFIHPVK